MRSVGRGHLKVFERKKETEINSKNNKRRAEKMSALSLAAVVIELES